MRVLLVATGTKRVRFEGNPVAMLAVPRVMEGGMGRFGLVLRAALALLLMAGFARAEDAAAPAARDTQAVPASEAPWQDVITAQIVAFREHDAPGAFQYSAAAFQKAFPTAEAFFATIIGSGYGPIMDSTSHTFGDFTRLDEHSVAQEVMFTGKDLSRSEAIYILTEEEGGWRVSGVQLAKTPGISV